jgi:DNA-binding FrmR family transcriptional regulator
MSKCENCRKKKHREEKELRALKNRLKRIEGQIRGIYNMLSDDAYCTDILTQVSAAQAALNAFSKELLGSHIRTCVVNEIKAGDDEVINDLVKTIYKLMK